MGSCPVCRQPVNGLNGVPGLACGDPPGPAPWSPLTPVGRERLRQAEDARDFWRAESRKHDETIRELRNRVADTEALQAEIRQRNQVIITAQAHTAQALCELDEARRQVKQARQVTRELRTELAIAKGELAMARARLHVRQDGPAVPVLSVSVTPGAPSSVTARVYSDGLREASAGALVALLWDLLAVCRSEGLQPEGGSRWIERVWPDEPPYRAVHPMPPEGSPALMDTRAPIVANLEQAERLELEDDGGIHPDARAARFCAEHGKRITRREVSEGGRLYLYHLEDDHPRTLAEVFAAEAAAEGRP